MPTLQWVGKSAVVNHHHDVPFRLLNKKYSFSATVEGRENTLHNRIIHGDNLEVLKSLLPEFEGKVNYIYIDDKIEYSENEPTTHGEEVKILPLLYDTILIRAEKRLLNLHSKVQDAPFLVEQQEALKKFLKPVEVMQPELAEVVAAK